MASIHKEVSLSGSPAAVWDVVSDVAAVHTRLAPGFVADTVMEGAPTRWCAPSHHNALFQVFAEGAGSGLVWIADLLPDAARGQRRREDGGRSRRGEMGAGRGRLGLGTARHHRLEREVRNAGDP
jgi:hypothetical protein